MTVPGGLAPAQVASIRQAQSRINIWEGSIRSGKTVGSLLAWVGHIGEMHGRSGEVLATGKTRETVARNVFGPLEDRDLMGPIARHIRYTSGAPTAQVLGERVHVIGANDTRSEEKIRGVTAKSAYGDEITTQPEGFFRQLLGRLSVPGARYFGSTNPDNPRHWLRTAFLLRADEPGMDLATWHFGLDDNPFLPPDYVAAIKAEYTGLWYRRFVLGEWCLAEGVVYDMWDESEHLVSELPELAGVIALGVDYGATHPTCGVLLALAKDGRLVVTREYRHDPTLTLSTKTIARVSAELREWLGDDKPRKVAVDPAAKVLKDQLRSDGMRRVEDADNAVLDGIRTVGSLLATGRLVVHESCKGLRDEFPGYSWDEAAVARGDDKPVKVGDDQLDALRYAIMSSRSLWDRTPARIQRPRGVVVPSSVTSSPRR